MTGNCTCNHVHKVKKQPTLSHTSKYTPAKWETLNKHYICESLQSKQYQFVWKYSLCNREPQRFIQQARQKTVHF